ncbi:MAG: 30S ribosomal protein S1 [Candidatus Cloacimonetes bacterium]|nr:30S ribosomal protein S1 [Candidatus Cloacimonadota bacterium]
MKDNVKKVKAKKKETSKLREKKETKNYATESKKKSPKKVEKKSEVKTSDKKVKSSTVSDNKSQKIITKDTTKTKKVKKVDKEKILKKDEGIEVKPEEPKSKPEKKKITIKEKPTITEKEKLDEIPSREKQIKMYEKTMESVKVGSIVEGTIVRVDTNEVFVDIGFKAEGAIQISEFKNQEVKEGNKIWVYIVSKERKDGRPRLSKERADIQKNWNELKDSFDNSKKVKGKITKRVKGGLVVDLKDISGFLPASLISTKTIPNIDHLIDKELEFKIVSFNREKENVVVSHKIVLEEELYSIKSNLLEKLKEGTEIDGVVKNIMDYGVFVDLGGIDGLLHISDMSWGHINHPSEMLNIGDKIKVKVLFFNKENEKVSLGLKQLVPHPWQNIEIKYPEGAKVEGRVTNITNYGAFVELEKGVEGLIHISEMSWTRHITHPKQMLEVGDVANAIILSVDKDEHRISLGLKQVKPNPWLTIDVLHPVGSKITGRIKNITNFGAFIEVENGIDGLIHISDLSWTKRILHPSEVLKKGKEVTAVVLGIDKVMQRIALGIKQLKPDPWENIEEEFPINSEHSIKILKIIPKGALISVKEDIEGFIPTSHLGIPGLTEPELAYDIGEALPVKVIEVDKDNRRLIFSVKTFFFGREEKEVNEFVAAHLEKIKSKRKEREKNQAEELKKKKTKEKKKTEDKENID